MEALGLLVALAVIAILAVQVFRRASRPPSHPPLDQSWQKKSRRAPTPAPKKKPPLASDRTPTPAGSIHERRAGLQPSTPSFDARTAHPPPQPRTLKGRAYVVDGDTIRIKKTQIRLFGVDAPEMNHPFGKRAKWAMFELCKNRTVIAEVTATDAHGRTVAKCFLDDGRDLSAELVQQGLALDWPKYSGGIYRDMETPDARRKLWLADARQKGRMDVWDKFDAQQKVKAGG